MLKSARRVAPGAIRSQLSKHAGPQPPTSIRKNETPTDNGPDADLKGPQCGLRLPGLHERVKSIGGDFQFAIEPGEGFALVARLSGKDALTRHNSGRPTYSHRKWLERSLKPHRHQQYETAAIDVEVRGPHR